MFMGVEKFGQKLPEEKRDKVCLIISLNPVDGNGTDLPGGALKEFHQY